MIKSSSIIVFFLFSSLMLNVFRVVDAHGYLKSPRSRNFVAYQDGVWYHGERSDVYEKETCPHCANTGGTCGVIGPQNYDYPLSITEKLMAANPQAVFGRGDTITVEVILTAHHMGHFEFKACAIGHGEIPTQECFDEYPLEFVSDELYGAPKDNNHVTRAYIPPTSYRGIQSDTSSDIVTGYDFQYKMKLPSKLYGDLVLLQWHYLTANTCEVGDYDKYDFPSKWGAFGYGAGLCDLPIPSDGGGAPEQFWNCAEIRILKNGGGGGGGGGTSTTKLLWYCPPVVMLIVLAFFVEWYWSRS